MEQKVIESGTKITSEPPLRVHIRVTKNYGTILGMSPEGTQETSIQTALRMVDEMKKVHPGAEICVEVEV